MRRWRLDVEHAQCGIDLQDGLPKLLDPRFADDILLFARNAHEALFLLENLMHEFAEVGLLLNAFVDTDGYQIASEKRVWCTQMYLDASSVWGRVEG